MAGEAGVVFVVLLMAALAVGGPLVLYALVRDEREDRQRMDRETAERVARRDTRDRER